MTISPRKKTKFTMKIIVVQKHTKQWNSVDTFPPVNKLHA